jgi:ribosomal protein L11 methyltransferase
MLRDPHKKYNRLYVYYFDRQQLPTPDDHDYIGTWIEDDKAILFFHQPKDDLMQSICRVTGASIIYQADLDYQDWEAGTVIDAFSTKTLTVCPVWKQTNKKTPANRQIVIDPSVIFGSGFHATTRLCLETLELIFLESGEQVETVLDLGTGTGLLGIAAAGLGAREVTAVDNNPMACEVAQKNVELNDCTSRVQVRQIDLMKEIPATEGYDLVIANLYKGLLLNLFDDPAFWKAKMYMVSGFISSMEEELLAALPARNINILHRGNKELWRLWLLKNMLQE